MKKCLWILLAILALATSSPNQQGLKTIVKINAFFHHFVHHITCNQERLGVIGFVQLYYSDHHFFDRYINIRKNPQGLGTVGWKVF